MARKNNVKSEHPGSISFDTRTRAVMAGPDSNDNIKEKVQSVREVVPGKSNNEIVLVLQYYDYNVEKAIQAYLEDGAKEALGEWHVPAAKANKKKKNKKKAASAGSADNGTPAPPSIVAATSSAGTASSQSTVISASNGLSSSNSKSSLPNGDLYAGDPKGLETSNSVIEGAMAAGPFPSDMSALSSVSPVLHNQRHNHRAHAGSHGHHGHSHAHAHSQRTRTASERSTASSVGAGGDNHSRRPFHGLEKSIKDLQRQTTSLERLRMLLDHEMDRSYKSIKTVFEEMRTHLNAREKVMMSQMDVAKEQAYDVFKMRQEKAAILKVQIARAEKLSESEVADLRLEVKHFVADRKIDEEIGKTTRFQYDSDHLRNEILNFGEVLPVKCSYTTRRPSVSSVASSSPADDVAPLTHLSEPVSMGSHHQTDDTADQMTAEELASLQLRLQQSLKIQGFETNNSRPSVNGSYSSASVDDQRHKAKNTRRRNRNRGDRQEQPKTDEGAMATSVNSASPQPSVSSVGASASGSRAATPSSTQASAGSASPSPQRHQGSLRRGTSAGAGGGVYRGRGRGGGGQGGGGYRGGQNQGRGSPRRPYSGSGGRGGGRGGGGGGGDQSRQGAPARSAVVVNGGGSS